ncbi:TPA: DapH/DapD/GlmU-related protein [Proteus mirabilis]|uniref:acyltransferase n=1 Tax=Proteus mirabilis TaxID=584 RepID=UPI0002833B0D|nr:acyltransferase [Proteus mirabilis]AUU40931.1 hypothetical protein MC73_018880 [Proteus mirabilis]EJD6086444.1 acyltransferase [Proteus mirabilis]EKA99999.1 hypothetical protein HMPREF1310_00113 [Proteus mirabilis WGLW4]EKV7293925.1 acyltransferase [Proteus mirabilis]ELA6788579.1 acyltransferase [Proteus mirabilis]
MKNFFLKKLSSLIVKIYVFIFYNELIYNKNIVYFGFFTIKNIKKLSIKGKVNINDHVYINAKGGITLGNRVTLSAGSKLISTGLLIDDNGITTKHIDKEIIISDNVQIGAGSIVLAGVSICENVVVGAGSIVTRNIEKPGVYVGSPAKCIRLFKQFNNDY